MDLRDYVNFSFLYLKTDRNSLCKSESISLPDAGISSWAFSDFSFSGKTFWNVTPYSVLASYLFLKIEAVSSSMASVTLWHTMRSCRQEDISVSKTGHNSKILNMQVKFLN